MKPAELERLLALADEVEDLERRLAPRRGARRRAGARPGRASRPHRACGAAMERAAAALEPIARELEREWVDQGPLVTAWQRAVELEQVAEAAGADPAPSAQEAEAARLARRGGPPRNAPPARADRPRAGGDGRHARRSPLAVELPPGGDDARPEAARREVLALIGVATEAADEAQEAGAAAARQAAEARAELDRLGDPADLRPALEAARERLPAEVTLDASAPASAAVRLARAGVRGALTGPMRVVAAGLCEPAEALALDEAVIRAEPGVAGAHPVANAPGRRDRPVPARRLGDRRRRVRGARRARVAPVHGRWRRAPRPGNALHRGGRPGGPSGCRRSASPTSTPRCSTGSLPPAARSASTRPATSARCASAAARSQALPPTAAGARRSSTARCSSTPISTGSSPASPGRAAAAWTGGRGRQQSRPDHVANVECRHGRGRGGRRRSVRGQHGRPSEPPTPNELELVGGPPARAIRRPRVACRTMARRHPRGGDVRARRRCALDERDD